MAPVINHEDDVSPIPDPVAYPLVLEIVAEHGRSVRAVRL